MSVQLMSNLFAAGALLAVSIAAGLLAGLASPAIPWVRKLALPASWGVAAMSVAGSLYYSEVVGFVPCRLCWFQRIAMYPLVVVLGIAILRRDRTVWVTGAALSGIGLMISSWHLLVQAMPQLESTSCSLTTPCASRMVQAFGFVSIPAMAAAGFLLIFTLMLQLRRNEP